jgi:5-oxoprolinase (ATP-hydrolysing)
MTNTRITDPEIFEHRYPVRLLRFAIRRNSGGKGRWKGGNGVEREFLFNASLEVNILSQHRTVPPYGLNGGRPGKTGRQYLVGPKGERKTLKGIDSASVRPGDRLVILTPGGGGYGRA